MIFCCLVTGCWENLIMFFFGYWATILDCDSSAVLKKVKKISMTSNVLPLHFAPSQASSSQNSNFDDTLEGYKIKSALPYKILSTLVIRWRMTAQTFSTPYGLRRPHWRGRWGWLRFWSGGWWGRWCPLHHTPLTTTNCKKDIQHNFSDTYYI